MFLTRKLAIKIFSAPNLQAAYSAPRDVLSTTKADPRDSSFRGIGYIAQQQQVIEVDEQNKFEIRLLHGVRGCADNAHPLGGSLVLQSNGRK
jgi:hypothetical protein